MSVLTRPFFSTRLPAPRALALWGLLAVAFVVAYAPSAAELARGLWRTSTHSHGPFMLAITAWLIWVRARPGLVQTPQPRPALGWPLLLCGLLLYVLGRSQGVGAIEVASLIPLLLGATLLLYGTDVARRLRFPLFFLLFAVPLPNAILDHLLVPMKLGVSYCSELLLRALDYPVAREGVMLVVGPYQMLVADACAGFNSLLMLEAMGLLYLNLVRHPSTLRNVVLTVLIVPISFVSNVLRVVALSLITYHGGDDAGRGFAHSFSGLLLFVCGLLLVVAIDAMLRQIGGRRGRSAPLPARPEPVAPQPAAVPPLKSSAAIAALLVTAAVAAVQLTPRVDAAEAPRPALAQAIPQTLGAWRAMAGTSTIQADAAAADGLGDSVFGPYDDLLVRDYKHADGSVIMLTVAYARRQRQEVKIHQPETCYAAQGFKIEELRDTRFDGVQASVPVAGKRLLAVRNERIEAVAYWIRIGTVYDGNATAARRHIFTEGLAGRVPDGVLVRVSLLAGDRARARAGYPVLEAFAADLVRELGPEARALLLR